MSPNITAHETRCTWQMFDEAIARIASALSHQEKPVGIYGIPRGGLVPAVALSHALGVPLLGAPCEGCIIVDDICDTGATLEPFAGRYRTVTLYGNAGASVQPDIAVYAKDGAWIRFPWEWED